MVSGNDAARLFITIFALNLQFNYDYCICYKVRVFEHKKVKSSAPSHLVPDATDSISTQKNKKKQRISKSWRCKRLLRC